MDASPSPSSPRGRAIDRSAAWRNWYRHLLPAYWLFLFCATHIPELQISVGPPDSDKSLHVAAFGVLAFLYWRFHETFRRPVTGGFVWYAAVVLLLYAGLDEYLQQFVGRSSDWGDWIADASGIVIVLVGLELLRRRRVHAAVGGPQPSGG